MSAVAPIRYRVAMPEPHSHEYHLEMEVPPLPEPSLELLFPVWAPGSYMVRDFSRHLYDLEATDSKGKPVRLERLDKARWRVSTGGKALRLRYRVFAYEQTVRTSYLDDRHAYWNGSSLFFLVDGEVGRPCEVTVDAPAGWRISTALPRVPGRNRFRAGSYDELADSPFEIGTHALTTFDERGARFEVAFFGRTNADKGRLLQDLRRIVGASGRLFGGFPFDRYLFIIHALPARGGGLEHARSCTLAIAGMGFEDAHAYQEFDELAAHEFFHAWNVKRIRDRVLGPFDYGRENYTRLLWFHEGFTEYMESIVLLRAGLLSPDRYLSDLAEGWGKYVERPGRNVTPLSELSFEAWIKQYKPADNHTNRMVSYYEKGKWVALVLELALREATAGRKGLPELFRLLWQRFGRREIGLGAEEVRAAADEIAGRSVGRIFDRYVDGHDEIPVPAALRRAGVRVRARPWWQEESDPIKARRRRGFTGLVFSGGDRAQVKTVVPGSPAWRAGLTYGDDVIAVGGTRVAGGTVARRLADAAPGEALEVTYFRGDTLRSATLVATENPERKWAFSLEEGPPARARGIRRGWLGA